MVEGRAELFSRRRFIVIDGVLASIGLVIATDDGMDYEPIYSN